MDSQITVKDLLARVLAISHPLAPFEMPLLDAHGATLAENIFVGERLVLRKGSRIRSTQIGLAASIGLARLPTQPHPRVVVISAGDDLVEPGQFLTSEDEEFETNSWMLATAMKEAGAVAYRVHAIPENQEQLRRVIEDQLVRADLIVLSGESHDGSFELMKEVLNELGEIVSVTPNLEGSARHCFGTIGEDNVPVIALPGDPIAAFLSSELFIRPMIRTMLGVENVFRTTIEAAVTSDIESPLGITSVILSTLERTGTGTTLITPLADQTEMCSLSDAQALLTIPAAQTGALSGEIVDAIVLERIS